MRCFAADCQRPPRRSSRCLPSRSILFATWRLAFAEEREREIIEGACDVCGTWLARLIRVTPVMHGRRFWRCEGGRRVATPLFVALVVIETTDRSV